MVHSAIETTLTQNYSVLNSKDPQISNYYEKANFLEYGNREIEGFMSIGM